MGHYFISTVICSGLLFFLYKALLENEKMHVFKRFYLLFATVVSLITPLLTLSVSVPTNSNFIQVVSEESAQIVLGSYGSTTDAGINVVEVTVWVIYLAVMCLAFSWLVKNVLYFIRIRKQGNSLSFNKARLVLTERPVTPHSFLNTIFINKKAYEEGRIEQEVLVHELAHVRQYHSLDILFVQLIQCVFWFNPFLYFYRRSMQLNHEFLADEAAVSSCNNPLFYQQLLLVKASGHEQLSLASQFNYSIIKKRLVMINKTSSPLNLFMKQFIVILLFIAIGLLFVSKQTVAQIATPQTLKKEVPSTRQGASAQLMNEYEAIVSKHRSISPKGYPTYSEFSNEEKDRLFEIYQTMTKDQQQTQQVGFMPKFPIRTKIHPTDAQVKEWVDAKKYFVRINGYRIKNAQLNNHRASDFDYYDLYKPNKGSTDYGKYYAQVNLMTKEAFTRYVEVWKERPEFDLAIFNRTSKKNGN